MLNQIARFVSGDTAKARDLVTRADRLRDARNWKEAAAFYKEALEVDDGLPHVWVQYGHALKESGSLQEAEKAYGRALALDDTADTHLQLGHLHKIMKRLREAEQDYLRAYERGPELKDVRHELTLLGWSAGRLRARTAAAGGGTEPAEAALTQVALELSDLVDFLQGARYPTGIQRVQLALAKALAETYSEDQVQFVYYDHGRYAFTEVDRGQIEDIVDLVENAGRAEDKRLELAGRLKYEILHGPDFVFPLNCTLVNVGTSWGYWNYFLSIRDIKRRFGVRYAPLIHDCIPLLFPEYCDSRLIADFINWLSGMFTEADLLFANSENTRRDAATAAAKFGLALPPSRILHLNGSFADRIVDDATAERQAQDLLRANNLDIDDFVLFVSTIEPRKNHVLALNAWSRMLKKADGRAVPRLVCVGNAGWMNDAFHQRLLRDKPLGERVVVLHNVSDQVLRLLYTRCLFTIFPSLYEGWGLPISEALAHGKVPLVSNVSSHPEAGGDLAVYFDLDSETDFQAKLEMLLYREDKRAELEARIAAAKPLRPWSEIGSDLFQSVEAIPPRTEDESAALGAARPVDYGRYYAFSRNDADRIEDTWIAGDAFRRGLDWHAPEPWGCWVRGRAGELAFRLPDTGSDDVLVFLRLTGAPTNDKRVTLSVAGSEWVRTLTVQAARELWEIIPVQVRAGSRRDVRIRLVAESADDFAPLTNGTDTRTSGVGVRGLYVCERGALTDRQAILEAITLGNLAMVGRRFNKAAAL